MQREQITLEEIGGGAGSGLYKSSRLPSKKSTNKHTNHAVTR